MKSQPIPKASEIPVYCKFDEIADPTAVKLYPDNYKKHPREQLERMLAVVRGNGYRRAAVVSKLSGYVTKGNGLVQMAQAFGLLVPIEYQEYASREEEIRDLLADNKLAELAETDDVALQKLLTELGSQSLELTGYDQTEVDELLSALGKDEEENLKSLEIRPLPKMAWVLVGIPLVHFDKINAHVEQIASIPDVIVETTVSDHGAERHPRYQPQDEN